MKHEIKELLDNTYVIKNSSEKAKLIEKLYSGKMVLSFLNAHAFNLCFKNDAFLNALIKSKILLRDGIGVKILFKILGKESGINMNGTDFIPEILNYKNKKIALFGTNESTLILVANKLKKQGHDIVCLHHGFSNIEHYIELAKDSEPELILLGMGMPKQEMVSLRMIQELEHDCLIINGGAIIDFLSGRIKRAPKWMQNMGLEWFYRFLNEPKRLFKRYFIGNFLFFINVLKIR